MHNRMFKNRTVYFQKKQKTKKKKKQIKLKKISEFYIMIFYSTSIEK